MKTFNCTQCGASIEQISLKDRWAHCEYCKARFLLPEEKRPIVTSLTFGVIKAGDSESDELDFSLWKPALLVLGFLLVIYGVVKYQEHLNRAEASRIEKAKEIRLKEVSKVTNVLVSVEWDGGSDDVLHYELPTLDTSAFALARRIENASGAKHVVVIRVRLDRQGNVTEAEPVSGNVMLQQLATKAAEKTVFSADPKKRTRTITYTFG